MLAFKYSRLIISLALVLCSTALASCAGQPQTECAPGLYAYKGGCLTAVSQNFATCTDTRGNNLTVEEKAKLGASVDTAIKGGGSGVIELSKTVVETELPEVAIQIVRDCLELSKSYANPAEQVAIEQQVDTLQSMLDEASAGTVSLKPDRGPYDQVIRVSGTNWPKNIEVEVTAGTSRKRTTTDDDGSFRTKIALDPAFEGVSPSTVEIRVSPVKASTQFPASALYEIVK